MFVSSGYDILEIHIKLSNQCRDQGKEAILPIFCTNADSGVVTLDDFDTTLWKTNF